MIASLSYGSSKTSRLHDRANENGRSADSNPARLTVRAGKRCCSHGHSQLQEYLPQLFLREFQVTELLAELCKFPPNLGSLAAVLIKRHEAALLAAPLSQRVLLGSAFCIEN